VRKKPKNRENMKKKQLKKPNREKKPIRILKKPTGSARFYKLKTKKIEPNPNRKKPEKNRAKPV